MPAETNNDLTLASRRSVRQRGSATRESTATALPGQRGGRGEREHAKVLTLESLVVKGLRRISHAVCT